MRSPICEVLPSLAGASRSGGGARVSALFARREEGVVGFFQPDGICAAVSVWKDVTAGLDGGADTLPEAGDTAPRSSELRRGLEAVFMCGNGSEPHDTADDVWSWSAVDGSGEPQKERYRQRTDGDSCSSGQRSSRPLRDDVGDATRHVA